jgi:translation initiation factor IF-1
MHPTDQVEVEGVIEAALPQALFRVRGDHGEVVTASLSAEARRVTVRVLPGDRVTVRLSPYDPGRGRIIRRH